MNNSNNDKKNINANSKIYYDVKRNFKDQIEKIKDQLDNYDKRSENLHNKSNDLIMSKCGILYMNYSKEHLEKHISFEDNSTESSKKFKSCKKYYTHDIIEYIQYNRNYFSKIEGDFKDLLANCDNEFILENNENNLKRCYSEAFQSYISNMVKFINVNSEILPKKEMYIYKIISSTNV